MKKIYAYFSILFISFCSCKDEEIAAEPPRDVAEQVSREEIELEEFLSSHYYNYEDFQASDSSSEIIIDSLLESNSGKITLIDQVEKKFVKVKTSSGDLINHPIYTIVAKEGSGQ